MKWTKEKPMKRKIICNGCGKEMEYEDQIHEILYNQFDRFPEFCGKGVIIPEPEG